MGRLQHPPCNDYSQRSKLTTRHGIITGLLIIVSLLVFPYQGYQGIIRFHPTEDLDRHSPDSPVEHHFQWDNIVPTPSLIYHPCYGDYQCARLELPMDWNRSDDQAYIALAVIKLPALVPVTDARYGGAVILNPGGPGGSGVDQVLSQGRSLRAIVDAEGAPNTSNAPAYENKYFDIISFDPRGVNNTTPAFSCFQNPAARQLWELQSDAEGILGSSEHAFDTLWARAKALGASCSQSMDSDRQPENGDWIGRHMNTGPVVADMVALIERHGEWRERETNILLSGDDAATKSRNRWRKDEEPLLFWGFSYGSVLGTTFAAMHPRRAHRMVFDGVPSAADYYAGDWLANLQDTDAVFEKFCEYCHQAGPETCPLAVRDDSAQGVKARVEQVLIDIQNEPIAVLATETRGPDIITYSDVKTMMKRPLYSPLTKFDTMARLLSDLLQRNGSSFADFKAESRQQAYGSSCASEQCRTTPGNSDREAGLGITCTDGVDITVLSKEDYRAYWQTLRTQSRVLGDLWAQIRLPCIGWKTRPAWEYTGPFTGNTSSPLLFIGNRYDPVTPLRNAVEAARGFPNSAVLEQNSVGHASYTAPSKCTAQVVRQYFQTGRLPDPGTICEVDMRPFQLPGHGYDCNSEPGRTNQEPEYYGLVPVGLCREGV